jgi:hypothetical protein
VIGKAVKMEGGMTTLIALTRMMESYSHAVAPESKCRGLSRFTHPAVVQTIIALPSDERTLEKIWEEPSPDEWRLALSIIAEQVLMHIAGYVDDDEFARDGCQFALDRFEKRRLAPTPRLH